MPTHTRTHVHVRFSNPYLVCELCRQPAFAWHDPDACGCAGDSWNKPCGHSAGVVSVCPSWSPVDGCQCQAHLGVVDHGAPRATPEDHPQG